MESEPAVSNSACIDSHIRGLFKLTEQRLLRVGLQVIACSWKLLNRGASFFLSVIAGWSVTKKDDGVIGSLYLACVLAPSTKYFVPLKLTISTCNKCTGLIS